jgi:tRNA threonylcarbamoyladenosine biosynthesis protein TsaB
MLLLAIDTSTLTSSVAVLRGPDVLAEREGGVELHSERLIQHIDESLAEAKVSLDDLSAIAIGLGPGSFTGLRIGMATAKGLCFATGKPLWAVSSLAALALDGASALELPAIVVPVMDARRNEVFAGFYEVTIGSRARSLAEERVLAPDGISSIVTELGLASPALCGDGAVLYAEASRRSGELLDRARLTPSAASVGKLAQNSDRVDVATSATPAYIRPSEVEVKFPDGNPGGPGKSPKP